MAIAEIKTMMLDSAMFEPAFLLIVIHNPYTSYDAIHTIPFEKNAEINPAKLELD